MFVTYKTPVRITQDNSEKVLGDLLEIIDKDLDIVLDMTETIYISSVALRLILIISKSLQSKNLSVLTILNSNDTIKSTIEMVGFNEFVEVK